MYGWLVCLQSVDLADTIFVVFCEPVRCMEHMGPMPYHSINNFTLKDDNARPHRSRSIARYFKDENIAIFSWPAIGHGMKLIKHISDRTSRQLWSLPNHPGTLRQLKIALSNISQIIPISLTVWPVSITIPVSVNASSTVIFCLVNHDRHDDTLHNRPLRSK